MEESKLSFLTKTYPKKITDFFTQGQDRSLSCLAKNRRPFMIGSIFAAASGITLLILSQSQSSSTNHRDLIAGGSSALVLAAILCCCVCRNHPAPESSRSENIEVGQENFIHNAKIEHIGFEQDTDFTYKPFKKTPKEFEVLSVADSRS